MKHCSFLYTVADVPGCKDRRHVVCRLFQAQDRYSNFTSFFTKTA